MAEYTPQFSSFKIISKLTLFNQFLFWSILFLSIFPVVAKDLCENNNLSNTINILNIISISLFFVIEILSNFILIPNAENIRRDDFIDNSFGSKFSPNNSIGYFDNEEIKKGLYKAAVNLFENCFFTYSLIKSITSKKVISSAIVLLSIIVIAYYGFKEVPFGLTLLRTLFSANLLGLLIKHLILLVRLKVIQDSWITLFHNDDLQTNTQKYQSSIYRYWLQYESLLSKISPGIPEKIYNILNPELTKAWEKMKINYNIKI